jgi:Mn2+/Fe2+ NRAMP family transporter
MSAGSEGPCDVSSPRSRRRIRIAGNEKALLWPLAENKIKTRPMGSVRRVLAGMVTGSSDVDPALVVTATVAGAVCHYSLLWSVLLAVPFLLAVFAVSARIGFETRQGLVDVLRRRYGRALALGCATIIVTINMAMIVADLMAVTDSFAILLQLPRMFFVAAVTFSLWYVLIFRDYHKITNALALLSLPLFIYVAAAVLAHPNWRQVISQSLFPRIPHSPGYPATIIAVFGCLLTPYVVVWQTSTRREEALAGAGPWGRTEHRAGTVVTTVLCFFIMAAAGTVLQVQSVEAMSTRMAAAALAPAVGELATVVFAVGIIGAGMVALPILVASMCYSVAEAVGWRSGLGENPWEAIPFYALISGAVFVAAALNFIRINAVVALYWSQILAGVLAVPILALILLISNDRAIMRTANTWWQNFWIGAAIGAILAASALAFWWRVAG